MEFDGLTFVFDVDDTILSNNGRNYENATPFLEVIDRINYLRENGAVIKLYTARGMISCAGDIEKIEAKNRAVLETWLFENNVGYDELIFGKPLADIYVDDKGMSLSEFMAGRIEPLNGKSGYSVVRIGDIVKKEMSEANHKKLKDWYAASEGISNNPKIISEVYSTVYMEYIDGVEASECLDENILKKAIEQIWEFKKVPAGKFDVEKLLIKIDAHNSEDLEWRDIVRCCKNLVECIDFEGEYSLSHSDYTLGNMVVKNEEIFLVDSLYDEAASSYLFDFAKLKMSLDGYEEIFRGKPAVDEGLVDFYEKYLEERGLLADVTILELMYAVRLWNYNDRKSLVKSFARKILGKINECL